MGRGLCDHCVELGIVIPTYNEAENIEELLREIKRSLERAGIDSYEAIVVDDSSSDGTAEIAKRALEELNIPGRVIVRSGSRGLTSAIVRGFAESRGRYVVVMDADLQHPPEAIPELFKKAWTLDLDIVVASRYIKGGGIEGMPIHRRFMSRVAALITRILIPQARGIRDPLSGFFLVERSVIEGMSTEDVERHGKSFKILLEILVKGKYEKVTEHPYLFRPRRRGKSKLGIRESIEFIRQVMELSEYRLPKFMVVGLSGVAVNMGMLYILHGILGISIIISSPVAIELATINNFTLNDRWTFKRFRLMGSWYERLLKYHVAVGLGNLVNYITVLALSGVFGVLYLISNIIGIALGFITNYLVSSEFVWEIARQRGR